MARLGRPMLTQERYQSSKWVTVAPNEQGRFARLGIQSQAAPACDLRVNLSTTTRAAIGLPTGNIIVH